MTTQLSRGDRVRVAIDAEGKHLRSYNATVKSTAETGKVYLVADSGRHKTVGRHQCTLIPEVAPPTLPDGIRQFAEYLGQHDALTRLYQLKAFRAFDPPMLTEAQIKSLAKLLLNGWSAEYALRVTASLEQEPVTDQAMHWSFPQAYYSVLFTARAFLSLLGHQVQDESLVSKQLGNYVWRGYYPAGLDHYVVGMPESYEVLRRRSGDQVTCAFLLESRDHQLRALRKTVQHNPDTALRSQSGHPIARFGPEQYKVLAKRVGYTTWFNLLARLRIADTNRELTALDAEVDRRAMHQQLVDIVSTINLVHEAYVVEALGWATYRQHIYEAQPAYLQNSFLRERLALLAADRT
ncbi:hypothetical protein FAES_4056 [Fibrella aestuarina BUZ 2]|uniref:Uncharacterized protein n=1 Tax=Fibrella aestuarina BUZ 2 TaxID=1166018 RepID=I0KD53_9BACT|nr:hypothetical protein [Fibrella aestuarina]CCH02056.1 hypothetical protein FAES_4056 [Fibrella aestuarina BUZ 2]